MSSIVREWTQRLSYKSSIVLVVSPIDPSFNRPTMPPTRKRATPKRTAKGPATTAAARGRPRRGDRGAATAGNSGTTGPTRGERSATAGTQAPPAFTPEQEVWIQQMISAHVDTRGGDDLPASNEDGDPNPTNSDPTGPTNTAAVGSGKHQGGYYCKGRNLLEGVNPQL